MDRPETAGIRELQRHACREGDGQHEQAQHVCKDRRAPGERERKWDEAGGPSRLRQRDGVGEAGEHPRQQLDRQHGEGAAEHERRPAPA